MLSYIHFEKGIVGNKAVIKGEWHPSFESRLNEDAVVELELNRHKGWEGNDIKFIQKFPALQALIIADKTLRSVEAVESLPALQHLSLFTSAKKGVDFSKFPRLTHLNFTWIKSSHSLFELPALRHLTLANFSHKSTKAFSHLTHLHKLSIIQSSTNSLTGLAKMQQLRQLHLDTLPGLQSFRGIEQLPNLEILEVLGCKNISSIKELLTITSLQKLLLNDLGKIDTLSGIEKLPHLSVLQLNESTNIADGNLLPLQKAGIQSCSFKNRAHYFTKKS